MDSMEASVAKAEAWVDRTRARNRAAQLRFRQRQQVRPVPSPRAVFRDKQFVVYSTNGQAYACRYFVPHG